MEYSTMYLPDYEKKLAALKNMRQYITPQELLNGAKKLEIGVRDLYSCLTGNAQEVNNMEIVNKVYSHFSAVAAHKKHQLTDINK